MSKKSVKKKKESKTEEELNKEMIDSVDQDLVPHGEGMTDSRIKKLRAELKRTGNKEEDMLKFYKIDNIFDLSEKQYIACMNSLKKKS